MKRPSLWDEAAAKLLPANAEKTVYFAHAQPVYGTKEEKAQVQIIAQHFPDYAIINPATVKDYGIRDMGFYLGIIERCSLLVYTRFQGFVLAGMGAEIIHALKLGKEVYELSEIGLTKMESVPEHLSYGETIDLFRRLRLRD